MNELEELVKKAVDGNKHSLDKVVKSIQDIIYNLAVRMLWHPEDAKDATQEILIRIITNLGSFKHKSSFKTWVYRIASNYLISFKQTHFQHTLSFDEFEMQLNQGFSDSIEYTSNEAELKLLVEEAKIGCSNAMLQCLSAESRLTYIIGEILEFNSNEGAIILDVTPEGFRQKLSRARKKLHQFLHKNCGIINPINQCRCDRKVESSVAKGLIQPGNLLFVRDIRDIKLIDIIDNIENEVALYQTNPDYSAPERLLQEVKKIISTAKQV